jgi:hypothetical protein
LDGAQKRRPAELVNVLAQREHTVEDLAALFGESVTWCVIDWRSGQIEPGQWTFGVLLTGPVRGRRRARSADGTTVSYSASDLFSG